MAAELDCRAGVDASVSTGASAGGRREVLGEERAQSLYRHIADMRRGGNVAVGFNASLKSIYKSRAILVVIADDAVPSCLTDPLPEVCAVQGVDCVHVPSKAALGKACAVAVDVIACSIVCNPGEDPVRIQSRTSEILRR